MRIQSCRWPSQGCGAGLRSKHYPVILAEWPSIDWFEAVTENFLDTGGRPLETLLEIRKRYPVALHGVALSIGSTDPLDRAYLERLRELERRIQPFVVSDHLCWTGVDGKNLHDLLPLPFTEEAIDHVVRRVMQVQEFLGRPILLENISTYVSYRHSTVPEWEFLREVAVRSDCGILLDLNNIYVNSVNHGFDAVRYLEEIPATRVGQFHLAGHTDKGAFLFDTHSGTVADAVWELYRKALALYGPVSTLVEWDEAIPDFAELMDEVHKAKIIYAGAKPVSTKVEEERAIRIPTNDYVGARRAVPLHEIQRQMKNRILSHNQHEFSQPILNPQGGSSGEARMAVYAEAYVARVAEALGEIYEAVRHLTGHEAFVQIAEGYIDAHPSVSYNLNSIGEELPDYLMRTEFAGKLPFLPDLARLEWRISRAFHAFERSPFDPTVLASRSEEECDRMRVEFQPSVSLVRSPWPLMDLWNARKTPPGEIRVDVEGRPQNVLVFRQGNEVRCELVEEAQTELLRSLLAGAPLGESCARLAESEDHDEPPMAEWFASWASRGLIAKVE